jgi:hypothetical protein
MWGQPRGLSGRRTGFDPVPTANAFVAGRRPRLPLRLTIGRGCRPANMLVRQEVHQPQCNISQCCWVA